MECLTQPSKDQKLRLGKLPLTSYGKIILISVALAVKTASRLRLSLAPLKQSYDSVYPLGSIFLRI